MTVRAGKGAGQVSHIREVFHAPLSLLSVDLSHAGLLAVKGMDDVMPELPCSLLLMLLTTLIPSCCWLERVEEPAKLPWALDGVKIDEDFKVAES